jgi:DNA-binding MarR family transcriptional regulator
LTRPANQTDGPAVEALLTILRICRVLERIDAGVSPQQYRMLKLIGEGGERSARLADRLAVARPTLTATADSLVAAGLAYREAEPGDRRVVRLRLTEAGQTTVARADVAYAEWFGDLLDHTGQREQIVADLLLLDAAMTERRRARAIAAAETAVAPPDTAIAPPDTAIARPDTAIAPPDIAILADTASTASTPEPLAVTQR